MTGVEPSRTISRISLSGTGAFATVILTQALSEQMININELQDNLDSFHEDIRTKVKNRRKKSMASHNKATKTIKPTCQNGEIVFVHCAVEQGLKLQYKWYGPLQIEQMHSPLVASNLERVHPTHLICSSVALEGAIMKEMDLYLADQLAAKFENVHHFTNSLQYSDQSVMVQIC